MPQKIAIVSSFLTEFALAYYFVEVFEKEGISYQKFTPKEQKNIDKSFDFILYVDDGTEYVVYPHPHALKVFYIVDTHLGIEDDLNMLKFVDAIFCAQKNAVPQLEHLNIPVHWLPLACSDDFHFHPTQEDKLYDIGFVGDDGFGRRKEIIEFIRSKFPNSFLGRAERKDIGKIYRQSKIVLNVAINNDINMRFFEALCSGSFLLTDKIDNNGHEDIQKKSPETFFIDYKTQDELLEKINYYLEHTKERETIAKAGRQFASNNQYLNRWQEIIKTVQENKYPILKRSIGSYNFSYLRLILKKIMRKLCINPS